MDFRKLISFGKSSFVISLPKAWVRQNKLQKGDLIYLEESQSNLVLMPKSSEKKEQDREITIQVDKKDFKQVRREIIGAYIKNNKKITLVGNEIKNKASKFQPIIQSLIALEVMEQTSTKIVAKDFLNLDDVSINSVIRKVDVVIRSMFEDCVNMFEEDTYESINFRDADVNKLVFLIFRIVRFGLENPSFMLKKFNLGGEDILKLWTIAFNLESLADEIKRIARYMADIKISKAKQQRLVEILKEIQKVYLQVLKSYHTQNVDLVHGVLNGKGELIKACNDFYVENRGTPLIGFLIDRSRACIGHIANIGRALYQ